MAWFTIRVVYQTTLPSFLAASSSAGSAATAFPPATMASATATTTADRCMELPPKQAAGYGTIARGQRARMRASMAGARGDLSCCRGGREIVAEPATQQIPDAGVAFAEHEMVGVADEVQLGGLPGALEQLDRLLGRGDGVIGGVQQQQRSRRNSTHDVVGAEVVHALRGLRRERVDGISGEVVAQVRRDRNDVVARHHQRLAGPGAVLAAFLEHVGEARPFLRALVLAAELALAVAPTAVGDHRRDALVDAAGIDGDRTAEARADDADAFRIDRRMLGEEAQRAARILDLLEADHPPELAFALAATAHVEAQHDIAELAQHLGRLHGVGGGLVAAEAVQHQEGGAPFARSYPARHMHDAGELQPGGRKGDGFFGHRCAPLRDGMGLTLSERQRDRHPPFGLPRPSSLQRAYAFSMLSCSGHTVGGNREPPKSGSGS